MPDTRVPGVTIRSTNGIVTAHPAWLHGTIFLASQAADYVNVYEGRDTTSGRRLYKHVGVSSPSSQIGFSDPIYCDRGIYLDFSTTGCECSVIWSPDDGEGPTYKQK